MVYTANDFVYKRVAWSKMPESDRHELQQQWPNWNLSDLKSMRWSKFTPESMAKQRISSPYSGE